MSMPLKTRLILSAIRTNGKPFVVATPQILTPAGVIAVRSGMTPKETRNLPFRYVGSGVLAETGGRVGRSATFLAERDGFILLHMMKAGAGHKAVSRQAYLRAGPALPQGSITMRTGDGWATVVSGPIQLLTSAEAEAAFGRYYVANQMFIPARDAVDLGIRVSMGVSREGTRSIVTVSDDGTERTVAVRRRRRMIEV